MNTVRSRTLSRTRSPDHRVSNGAGRLSMATGRDVTVSAKYTYPRSTRIRMCQTPNAPRRHHDRVAFAPIFVFVSTACSKLLKLSWQQCRPFSKARYYASKYIPVMPAAVDMCLSPLFVVPGVFSSWLLPVSSGVSSIVVSPRLDRRVKAQPTSLLGLTLRLLDNS